MADKVVMSKEAFVKEHKRLSDVLKNPTPKKLAKEAATQDHESHAYDWKKHQGGRPPKKGK